jgi:pyruvate dehydrogenase E2 component (dihydrolipoamide acetyltransferase)
MAEIVMPRLSDTMEEGTILRWLKAEGEQVARGEELVEIETDKATMTYESDQAGTLTLIAAEGDTLAVGEPIARIGDASESPDSGATASTAAEEHESDESTTAEPSEPPSAKIPEAGERVKASPLAKRIAREDGVELRGLSGSGPGGRIVKADVLAAEQADARPSGEAPSDIDQSASAPPAIATAKGETTEVELSRTQQTIARRMAESKATIPDFTLQMDVDMEACVSLRSELKRIAHHEPGETEGTPTYNDMVVKACALALREHPHANGGYRDGRLQLHSRINVGVAVAADDALVVPTVFDADEKSLGEIAREARVLAGRVRDGSITPPELGGGTFTVSNLGMFGVRSFSAIINPPQAAIMSVGSVEQRAVVLDGEIVARHTMSLTLVSDHRVLYGAEAARFLARVRELLQTPSALTL